MDYLQNPLLLTLLPYLAIELSSAMRVALLGLAAGFHPSELHVLPGLGQPKRLRQALKGLEAIGRIVRSGGGYTCVPAAPPLERDVMNLLKRHSKLRRALDMIADPLTRLNAWRLGSLADELCSEARAALAGALGEAAALRASDALQRRRSRRSVLSFVARRVSSEQSRATPLGPRPPRAPHGLLERSQHLLPEYSDTLTRLYTALVPYGDDVLDHWWRILEVHADCGLTGAALWQAWRLRIESYVLRRRIPLSSGLRLHDMEANRLKALYPVPDVGYGLWVEAELALWRRFRTHFAPAMGYLQVRALWAQAHETVPAMLRAEHPGATASAVMEDHYDDCLFRAAEACSGLGDRVLDHLRRGLHRTAAVRAARANADREASACVQRAALLKAARIAADGRTAVTDRDQAEREWALNLLRAVAFRETPNGPSAEVLSALVDEAARVGRRGGRRFRQPRLMEVVRRELEHDLQLRPVVVGPRERVPLERVWDRVRRVREKILAAQVSAEERRAALHGLCDYVQHRDCIILVNDDGTAVARSIRDVLTFASSEPEALALVATLVARIRHDPSRALARKAA